MATKKTKTHTPATLGKSAVVEKIAEKTGATKKDTAVFLDAFLATVEETLVNRDKIQIPGFGTFETKERAAREGKNPRTGEAVKIPASTTPHFKAGKSLKDAVK